MNPEDKRTESQFSNVFDFSASKNIKSKTGVGRAVRKTSEESPEFKRRADEAMQVANPIQKKERFIDKASRFLSLDD